MEVLIYFHFVSKVSPLETKYTKVIFPCFFVLNQTHYKFLQNFVNLDTPSLTSLSISKLKQVVFECKQSYLIAPSFPTLFLFPINSNLLLKPCIKDLIGLLP